MSQSIWCAERYQSIMFCEKTWTHKSKIVNMKNVKLLAIKWICEFNWYIVQSASHEP